MIRSIIKILCYAFCVMLVTVVIVCFFFLGANCFVIPLPFVLIGISIIFTSLWQFIESSKTHTVIFLHHTSPSIKSVMFQTMKVVGCHMHSYSQFTACLLNNSWSWSHSYNIYIYIYLIIVLYITIIFYIIYCI